MFNNTYKRLPENPNIKLHWEPHFNGLEVLPGIGPFVEPHLTKIDQAISWAVERSSKVYAVRLDLRFPQNYEFSGLGDFSNVPIQRFFKFLRKRLDRYCQETPGVGLRRHPHNLVGLWSREYDKGHTRPHFHILLLLNGQTFRALGDLNARGESLYQMVEDSWLSALWCKGFGRDHLVHRCEAGEYWLTRNDSDGVNDLFRRASYMAKARDKDFADGYHRFGGSRMLGS